MKRLSTEHRQEQIIDEAINLIHERGYSALSIRELAHKVGISEAAIYRHFNSKDDIIVGIFNRIQVISKDLFITLQAIDDTDKKLKAFILFHMNLFTNNPELISVLMAEDIIDKNSSTTNELKLTMKDRQTKLINIIEEGIRNNIFKKVNSDFLATMIQGYIRLTLLRWKRAEIKFSLINNGENFFKTLQLLMNTNKL